jgi:Flp pilus assembly protein TadB
VTFIQYAPLWASLWIGMMVVILALFWFWRRDQVRYRREQTWFQHQVLDLLGRLIEGLKVGKETVDQDNEDDNRKE